MITPAAQRVIRQHARTAQLLGVDFLPVAANAPQAESQAAPQSTPQSEANTPEVRVDRAAPLLDAMAPKTTAPAGPGRSAEEAQAALDALRAKYEADAPHAQFVTSFTNIVFGEGHPRARLMFVGEAPGADEDRTGRPFVGRAGQLLDKMIVAMGLSRDQVYIANVLKTRPPNNATPTSEEARLCAPYLYEQIRIVAPEVIVTLGLPATRLLLETTDAMGKLRGNWASVDLPPSDTSPAHTAAAMPTYHPAYLLRSYTADNRAKVWSDLKLVMDKLGLAATR